MPKDRENYNKYMREWYHKNKDKKAYLKYGEKSKIRQRKFREKYRREEPEKIKARRSVFIAVRSGSLKRKKNCENCNSNSKIQAHHHDYSKPLEVLWVCKDCHSKIHRKNE